MEEPLQRRFCSANGDALSYCCYCRCRREGLCSGLSVDVAAARTRTQFNGRDDVGGGGGRVELLMAVIQAAYVDRPSLAEILNAVWAGTVLCRVQF